MRKIEVLNYDSSWKDIFNDFKKIYQSILTGLDIDIVHVGSTSIEGLAAKPIIDIDIIVNDDDTLKVVIKRLEGFGYIHQGNLGITGREAFKLGVDNPELKFPHHLYAGLRNSLGIRNHLALKEYLINNPKAVLEYSKLKKDLAIKYPNDIDSYIDGKTDFIVGILNKCGITEKDRKEITYQNKQN